MKNVDLFWVLVAVLILLIPIQTISSMRHQSIYGDEAHHIVSGYTKLKTLDFRMMPEQGPLVPMISAFPLLFMNINFPFDHPSWNIKKMDVLTYVFLFESGNDPYKIVFWSRIPMVLMSMILAFFVYKWANELYGKKAGLFALFLYVFSQDMLAHAQISSSDFGLAFFSFIALYCLWKFYKNPSKKSLIIAGITLGLAQLTKFSAIFLFPIYFAIGFFVWIKKYDIKLLKLSRLSPVARKGVGILLSFIIMVIITYFVIIITYKGEGMFIPLAQSIENDVHLNKTLFPLQEFTKGNNLIEFAMKKIPSPLPYYYARGLGFSFYMSKGEATSLVLNGQPVSKWYFFILAFLFKTPIPMLIFILIAILFYYKYKKNTLDDLFLIVPFVLIHAAFTFTTKQFGYRYVIQTIPFIFVFVSRITRYKFSKHNIYRVLVILLGVWYVWSSITIYPHYLSYVNEFIGQENAYLHFVDSTIDWGQDLFYLRDYLNSRNIKDAHISYYGFPVVHGHNLPDYYNISYTSLECGRTQGIVAISVTNLMKNQDCYGWLLKEKFIDRIGYSMLVYNIS